MHAFDHAIGFEEKQPVLRRRGHDRTIVARPGDHVRPRFEPRHQLRNQPLLAQLAQFHCGIRLGKASALRERKLKSACIVIETRMEPLHS